MADTITHGGSTHGIHMDGGYDLNDQ
jgi:hypothetical protein